MIKKGCSWTVWSLAPKERQKSRVKNKASFHSTMFLYVNLKIYMYKGKLVFHLLPLNKLQWAWVAMTTVYLHVFLLACYWRLSFPGTCCLCCWRLYSSSLAARAWARARSSCSWGLRPKEKKKKKVKLLLVTKRNLSIQEISVSLIAFPFTVTENWLTSGSFKSYNETNPFVKSLLLWANCQPRRFSQSIDIPIMHIR